MLKNFYFVRTTKAVLDKSVATSLSKTKLSCEPRGFFYRKDAATDYRSGGSHRLAHA